MAGTGLGTLFGGLLAKEPVVPDAPQVDIAAEQKKAISSNIKQSGLITELANLVNKTALQQGMGRIDALLGQGTREQITSLLQSGLKGELPKDMERYLERKAAEAGAAQGISGGEFGINKRIGNLLGGSYAMTQQALDAANRWLTVSQSQVPQFDFTQMFVSPGQAIQQANINAQNVFEQQWMKNQLEAAYDPMTILGNAMGEFDQWIGEMASSVAGKAVGGAI